MEQHTFITSVSVGSEYHVAQLGPLLQGLKGPLGLWSYCQVGLGKDLFSDLHGCQQHLVPKGCWTEGFSLFQLLAALNSLPQNPLPMAAYNMEACFFKTTKRISLQDRYYNLMKHNPVQVILYMPSPMLYSTGQKQVRS